MTLDKLLAELPKDSKLRDLLPDLASADETRRVQAYHRARGVGLAPSAALSEAEAHVVLRAAATVEFPLPTNAWEDGFHVVLFWLLRGYESLPPLIGPAYAKQTDHRRRCALLSALGAVATREAAEVFMACVREHGWPALVYPRVFGEMANLMRFPEVVLPEVVLTAGKRAGDVAAVVIEAILTRRIDPAAMRDRLEGLAPHTLKLLRATMKSVAKQQKPTGIAWRFKPSYQRKRHDAGVYLDLAGYHTSPKLGPLLREATQMADPRLIASAALGLLRRGEPVDDATLERVAACHETRAILFDELQRMGQIARFPAKWRTWDAFAASQMVKWLIFPTELGREPDEIELQRTEWVDEERRVAVHLWRFRNDGEPWMAATSGPYELVGEPVPPVGASAFSRFEEWDAHTPAEHIQRCLGSVAGMLDAK